MRRAPRRRGMEGDIEEGEEAGGDGGKVKPREGQEAQREVK